MKKHYQFLLLLLFVLPNIAKADVKLNALFSDHMVIQRETVIPIWGWADASEIITVETSWGASAQVITDKNGNWRADIKTPKAGGPHQITVFSKNKIVINDVLSGEVWLCTGQSNMDFDMSKFANKAKDPKDQPLADYIKNEIATANDDWIRHIEVPQTTSLLEKKMNFEDSWRSVNPSQTSKITATGYFFAKELRKRLNVPVGLVECSWGGTRVQPWISEEVYLEDKNRKDYYEASTKESLAKIEEMNAAGYVDTNYQKQLAEWEKKGKVGKKPKPTNGPLKDMQLPATLYNGMLSAVIPYAIKGAIWYQGESNAVFMPNEYEDYFTAMIKGWRKDWKQGDFSFYWVQLAACNRGNDKAEDGWATVNDQLRRSLKLPNTGMAVLYDIGEPMDIHPHNKMDAGKRLALWALQKDYKMDVTAVSGPLYKDMQIKGNKIEIDFSEVGSGLMVGNKDRLTDTKEVKEPLNWFEIVGADGIWKVAKAKIVAKNKIEVSSDLVANPVNVRYAWKGNPEGANLYNKEGLPAAVFSTIK
ncbi:sialate O-acetylesterase [Flavobacterium algicola]|uniref:sialate O-acetylesterase n=1 Tax=Flavobacterium algicola TaxID=556529 RepID=UPI001EFC746E|nr:sialate O-acetylesterase [Flavobacterium algicola]MCG9793173.1 sialate O-acetylesterase [Flavobacterium algicola]